MKWISARDFAKSIELPYGNVLKLIREGNLPALKIGNRYKMDEEAANDAIRSLMYQPKPGKEKGKKEFDRIGRVANDRIDAAGGFENALDALCRKGERTA
jgi:excisionase family DNA binding protein